MKTYTTLIQPAAHPSYSCFLPTLLLLFTRHSRNRYRQLFFETQKSQCEPNLNQIINFSSQIPYKMISEKKWRISTFQKPNEIIYWGQCDFVPKMGKIANDQCLELNGEPQISLNDLKFVVHVLISIYCPLVSITKTIGLEKNFSS